MKRTSLWLAGAVICVTGAYARDASASPSYTAYDLLKSFNIITSGNATTSSETEGSVLIGGNLTSGNGGLDNKVGAGAITTNLAPFFGEVNVYGNAAGNWSVTAGDTVLIGGSNSATFANAGSVTAGAAFPISFADVQSSISTLEADLTSRGGTAVTPSSSNVATFTGAKNGGTDVFTISLADLQSVNAVSVDLGSGASEDSAIVNVTGAGAFSQNFNFIGGPDATHIIWNFEDATSLSISGYEGSILALDATVTNTSRINGTVAAASYIGTGELHSYSYTGNQPPQAPSPPSTPPTTVPEPAPLSLLATALLGLVTVRFSGSHRRIVPSPA